MLPIEHHQLGDGRFDRAIPSADDARFFKLETGVIAFHSHRTCNALADVNDGHTALGGPFQNVDEPGLLRCIAATIGAHHHAFQLGRVEHMLENGWLHARKERQHHDVLVELCVGHHGTLVIGLQYMIR